ncbi:MAG: hypothetical protein IPO36_14195 [Anaerolineales bacterium]|nr:hypothetical protein [Anaerolineales bacterium]
MSSESGSYPEKSLDDLIYETDTVVVGHFTSTLPSRWNTPNGKLPEDINSIQEILWHTTDEDKGINLKRKCTIGTFGGAGEDWHSTNQSSNS